MSTIMLRWAKVVRTMTLAIINTDGMIIVLGCCRLFAVTANRWRGELCVCTHVCVERERVQKNYRHSFHMQLIAIIRTSPYPSMARCSLSVLGCYWTCQLYYQAISSSLYREQRSRYMYILACINLNSLTIIVWLTVKYRTCSWLCLLPSRLPGNRSLYTSTLTSV